MLDVTIPAGALFYGKTSRRMEVLFDDGIRKRTESLVERLHELDAKGVAPLPRYGVWCERCSLVSSCRPKAVNDSARIRRHLKMRVDEIDPAEDSLRFYLLGKNWTRRVEHVGAEPSYDPEGPLIA